MIASFGLMTFEIPDAQWIPIQDAFCRALGYVDFVPSGKDGAMEPNPVSQDEFFILRIQDHIKATSKTWFVAQAQEQAVAQMEQTLGF